MPASDIQATELADMGYHEAIRLMQKGLLANVVLWRREAFDRYRDVLTDDGQPDPEWMERFNSDLSEVIGPRYSATFLDEGDIDYPASRITPDDGPVAVIRMSRKGGGTSRIILRPKADQVLEPVRVMRMFP